MEIGMRKTNGSYRPVVKSKSNIPVSNPFSTLKEDNGIYMDELVYDTRKKLEDPLRKTGIWYGMRAERNLTFFPEMEVHYFDRDGFANMDPVVKEEEHENVLSKHG
ncbi:hypothetical protein Tco_1505599 [Tanacetum coccineum]